MATDPKAQAAMALHRFGLGPRPGSIAAIASDPRGALLAEIERPGAGRLDQPGLMTSAQAARAAFEDRAARRAKQILEQRAQKEAEARKTAAAPGEAKGETAMRQDMAETQAQTPADPATAAKPAAPKQPQPLAQKIFLAEVKARLETALAAEIGFAERLVWFWSNHFCVSAAKVLALAGGYEREAIRPHILGPFAGLLLAAEGHPGMLAYLDNAASIGPNSVAGINRDRGLNENLAREILELHTLGVRGGYSQDDVTSFAKILTGWTIIPTENDPERGAEFVFNKRMHEPGSRKVLGKTYADSGVDQGRAVLRDLARHPATADHIAAKLARHFVADAPPPALTERLARTFRDTDGSLAEVAKALIASPEAWDMPQAKLKRPSEWTMAMMRAVGTRTIAEPQRYVQGQTLLGEPVWRPPAPKGFADDEAAWIDGLGQRLDIANIFAQRVAESADPGAFLDEALGPLASRETRQAVARAESRQQALTLAFMSPEFQRR
jgi:uncharacterized protein (DUF1800 family)